MNGNLMHFHSKAPVLINETREHFVSFTGILMPHKNTIDIGLSICSNKDSMFKKKGRIISSGRAEHNPHTSIELNPEMKPITQFIEKCKELCAKGFKTDILDRLNKKNEQKKEA